MEENKSTLNNVIIEGEICSEFIFIHELKGKNFYLFEVGVKRLSGKYDYIKCMASEDIVYKVLEDESSEALGTFVKIKGSYRSFNRRKPKEYENKVMLNVLVKDLEVLDNESHYNKIYLNGFVCKKPVFRKTPFGREITDVLLAVHRSNGKSDYIPCICWGWDAKRAENLNLGDSVNIIGRIESRVYTKEIDDNKRINKTAYEVSVSKFEVV